MIPIDTSLPPRGINIVPVFVSPPMIIDDDSLDLVVGFDPPYPPFPDWEAMDAIV